MNYWVNGKKIRRLKVDQSEEGLRKVTIELLGKRSKKYEDLKEGLGEKARERYDVVKRLKKIIMARQHDISSGTVIY